MHLEAKLKRNQKRFVPEMGKAQSGAGAYTSLMNKIINIRNQLIRFNWKEAMLVIKYLTGSIVLVYKCIFHFLRKMSEKLIDKSYGSCQRKRDKTYFRLAPYSFEL